MSATESASGIDLSYKLKPNCNDLDHLPGQYGLPLIGRTFDLIKDFPGLLDDIYTKYGAVSKIGLVGQRTVMVLGPELNKQIYLDKDRVFSAETGYADTLGKFYGGGLLMRDFDDHRFQRRIFQNAFKNDAMRDYTDMMNPIMEANIRSWKGSTDFKFFNNVKETLLDAAATIFLGIEDFKGEEAKKMSKTFVTIADGMLGVLRYDTPLLPFGKWRKGMVAKRYMEAFLGSQIEKRRASDGKDMFTFMCKEKRPDTGEYFSNEDIIAHINFLLFAAHDTTASNLTYIMQHLGQNPEWQERAREEARSMNKAHLDYDDLDKVELMDRIHLEALRLHPSVQMMQRRTIRDTEMGGYKIPANTIVAVAPSYSHIMEEYWDKPRQFDPDRFAAPRNEHKRHPFQFVGFGGGAHKCIGMHFAGMIVKTFLHQMLLNYRWKTVEGYNPVHQYVPLPKQADDLPLILESIR